MDWDQLFKSRSWGQYPSEDLIRFIVRTKPKRVLEIGCGPGANLWMLARAGIEFDAFDISPAAVRQAKERLDRETPGWRGRIETADIAAIPKHFQDYDAAIDCGALTCVDIETAKAAIADIRTRLKPSGILWSKALNAGIDGYRLTSRQDIETLYAKGWTLQIGESTRHTGNPTAAIREWVIEATKDAA